MLLHVLRHVEADERVVVAEEELGERLGQLGLADSRRSEEDERTGRPLRILQPGAGAADGLADRPDGVVLADDPLVQFVLHAQQLRGFRLGELVDGNARPHRQHLGDALLVHLVEEVYAGAEGLGLGDLPPQQQLLLAVAQAAGLLEVLRLDGLLFAGGDDLDLGVDLQQAGGDVHPLEVQPRAGLVDQVDGLVGQVPVGDVAVGEVGRRHECLVGDGDPVVCLVAVAQSLEDLDRVAHAGLGNLDGLEAALEGGVPSRDACGTRRAWLRRWSAARHGPAWASGSTPRRWRPRPRRRPPGCATRR